MIFQASNAKGRKTYDDHNQSYAGTTTPNTGDNVMYFVVTLIVSALGLASIVAYKKLSK